FIEITLDYHLKHIVAEKISRESIQYRSKSGNRRREETPAWFQYTKRFLQRLYAIFEMNEVIQWAQFKDRVDRRVLPFRQVAGIADSERCNVAGRRLTLLSSLCHQTINRINQVNFKSEFCQPEGVGAGAPSNIENRCG